MRNGLWFYSCSLGALAVAVCTFAAAHAGSKKVEFDTLDGVTLEGDFYEAAPVAPATNKDATVLLLHNIDKVKGGNSHVAGWPALAQALQDDGYTVLSFDFRGFGESKAVSKDFWDRIKNPHNANVKGANKNPPPDSIDHKDFDNNSSEYYPYLVNDIAAAKAFLDRRSDAGQGNTSNLIVIGAGEGATLGAMWMASEWHRQKVSGVDPKTGKMLFDEPEGRDQAAAVWLTLSPKLGGREIPGTVHAWMKDMAATNKVPMAFVYGKDDDASESVAKRDLEAIQNKIKTDYPSWDADKIRARIPFTNVHSVEGTKLSGSDLLTVGDTQEWIVSKYLGKALEGRNKETRKRDIKEDNFLWTFPGSPVVTAKVKGEDNLHLVPVDKVLKINN